MWISDPYGLADTLKPFNRHGDQKALTPSIQAASSPTTLPQALLASLPAFTITTRPPERLAVRCVWATSRRCSQARLPLFFVAFIVAGTMWYGSAATPVELFGPTRYQWDQSYFKTEINRRVQTAMDEGSPMNRLTPPSLRSLPTTSVTAPKVACSALVRW